MISIPAVTDANGVQSPETPLPVDAVAIVCDGSTYTVYEPGDALPAPPDAS
jgi:hypothetical protein